MEKTRLANRVKQIEDMTRFVILCNTCHIILMQSPVDPDSNQVLRIVARQASLGHSQAYTNRHVIEKCELGTGISTTICK